MRAVNLPETCFAQDGHEHFAGLRGEGWTRVMARRANGIFNGGYLPWSVILLEDNNILRDGTSYVRAMIDRLSRILQALDLSRLRGLLQGGWRVTW